MKLLILLTLSITFLTANININYANIRELSTLKGIGTKKANAIIKYRKVHCFKKVEEIIKVKGIGKKFLEKNKKNIEIGNCKR